MMDMSRRFRNQASPNHFPQSPLRAGVQVNDGQPTKQAIGAEGAKYEIEGEIRQVFPGPAAQVSRLW
jgi:hypothetical protein